MDDSEQNKSEQASSFKLSKARQKGSVARGMDLGFFASLVAFITYGWIAGPALEGQIATAARRGVIAAPDVLGSSNELLAVTGILLTSMMRPLALLAGVVFLTVLAFELLQTGFVFSTEPLRLDFNRLNPGQNLKRLFSLRLLVETGKNLLKMAAYGTIAYLVIRYAVAAKFATITDAQSLAAALTSAGLRLLLFFAAAAAVIAGMDQFIVRRDFSKKMRMSRREVRRESRDREGEPRMKQKRKQLHGEFVKLSQSLRNIKGADVLITNPTHFAVALRYDGRTMTAPKVVAQGTHQFALRLKRLAFLYGVVIVQNRELARALYYKCALNAEVPEALYQPVADIYTALRRKASDRETAAHV